MSNISIMSSLPRTIIRGFKDSSRRSVPMLTEDLPQYLPWYMLFTEWGPDDDALFTTDSGFTSTYGQRSLDPTQPYMKHATECARLTMGTGNIAMITRLVAPDADTARYRLSLEWVEDDIPEYERNADGTYKRDVQGNLILTGQTVYGVVGRWLMQPIGEINGEYQFGRGNDSQGTMTNSQGQVATITPIMDVEARFKGKRGNNIGLRIASPTMTSQDPVDGDMVDEMGAAIHRVWVVERESRLSNATIYTSLDGEQYVDFTLKPNTVFRNKTYHADESIIDAYEESDPANRTTFGLLKRVHTYSDHVLRLQQMIYGEEEIYDTVNDLAETPEQTINLFTGVHYNDVPYYSFQLKGPLEGGLQFSENTTHYLIGGSDGDTSDNTYDALVNEHLSAFMTGPIPYMDSARYPFSAWCDSGYSLETKKKAINILNRKDTLIDMSTQEWNRPINTPSEDSSMGVALRAWLRSLPESTYHGTAACRASIWAHAGLMHGTDYKKVLPFSVSIAKLTAEYAGAGDGIMVSGLEFDSARNGRAIVRDFKTHNVLSRDEAARNKDWNNGINFAQWFDRKSIHWPGQQSIYDNDTSILRSRINVLIGCNLTRIGEQAWRMFTGDAKLTDLQLITEVDKFINAQAKGRYDSRVIVDPESYYTAFDKAMGNRYTTVIRVGGQQGKLVEDLTIEFFRREDLEEGAN